MWPSMRASPLPLLASSVFFFLLLTLLCCPLAANGGTTPAVPSSPAAAATAVGDLGAAVPPPAAAPAPLGRLQLDQSFFFLGCPFKNFCEDLVGKPFWFVGNGGETYILVPSVNGLAIFFRDFIASAQLFLSECWGKITTRSASWGHEFHKI